MSKVVPVPEEHVFYSNVDPAEGQRSFRLRGLDGLRAIAVATVLIYHLWPAVLPGGMMGVDIFFVVSGFLITALLLREGAFTGKMNIIQFWIRRARRLLPAIVVLVIITGTAALLVGGDVQVGLKRQIIGAFTFSSNWLYIATNNDYFAQTSPELLTNFWSLAVEEQFYIFWPIALVLVFMFVPRWSRRVMIPVGLALLSVILCTVLVMAGASPSRIYYGTDTHLFGIMLGVSLALLIPWSMYPPEDERIYRLVGYGSGFWGFLRTLVAWVCLASIIPLATVWGGAGQAFFMPWGLLLASILALGVIQGLLADVQGPGARLLRALLEWRPFVWVGKRSYGIYLWHWPLAVLAHYIFGPHHSKWTSWIVLVLSLIAAGLSYMYVEEPIRRAGFRGATRAWGRSLIGPAKTGPIVATVALLLCAVGTGFALNTAPAQTEAETLVAQGESKLIEPSQPLPSPTDTSSQNATSPEVAPGSVSIIGDSVTVASAEALHTRLPQAHIDAEVSRTLVAELPHIKEAAKSHELGQVVVVSLSTNSTMSQEQLDELVQTLAPQKERKIVLVTGVAPSNLTWVKGSNQLLHDTAKKYPQTVVIADWATAAKDHTEYFGSDGVHPQADGQQVYAQTIAEAVTQAQEQLTIENKLSVKKPNEEGKEKPAKTTDDSSEPSPASSKAW